VLALAFLFFGIAMVLLGVVDVGASVMTAAGGVRVPGGLPGSFLGGVLATAVATPCTAPFMGTAVGWALVAPPAAALAVFTALALGMGLPYVALAASPALLRALPRPGPWMETLKQALAFPMLATVVWLLWVLGRQAGAEAQVMALGGLLLAGFGCWLAGRFATPAAAAGRRHLAVAAALVAVVGGFALALPSGGAGPAAATAGSDEHGLGWEPYSPGRLAALRAAGRPVYVDFTAAWCITCQVNERVVFGSAAVRDAFREHGVVPMRADWTTQDPEITRALASFGRSGVPLTVVYPGDATAAPLVQPTILTPGVVLAALDQMLGDERRPR
jgi:thiol:disulfide interchange protein DsbD